MLTCSIYSNHVKDDDLDFLAEQYDENALSEIIGLPKTDEYCYFK